MNTTSEKIASIKRFINLNDYDSLNIGEVFGTDMGEFACISKPNIYQPIDSRTWQFEHVTDVDGEPFMAGEIVTITLK